MAIFIRLLDTEGKVEALRAAIRSHSGAKCRLWFEVDPESFGQVPGSPFAYWVSEALRGAFTRFPRFEGPDRRARQGLATADDTRFVRLWTETPVTRKNWRPFAKGGVYSPYYADVQLVVNWDEEGLEIRRFERAYIRNEVCYSRAGLTWPRRTQSGLALRAMPAGCVFADKGPAAFVEADDPTVLLALLALTNSEAFRALVTLQMAFGSYEVGVIQRTPVPELEGSDEQSLANLARRAWSIKRELDTAEPTSHAFVLPALLRASGVTVAERTSNWLERLARSEEALTKIQADIDARCFDLYGFTDEDREQIMQGSIAVGAESTDDEAEIEDSAIVTADTGALGAGLVEWLVGVALGRFDVRLATGERHPPAEPDPFEALPTCSPGMLSDERGLPLEHAPDGYPLELPAHGVLLDDPGFDHDLSAEWDMLRRVREVLSVVFGEQSTDIEAELCNMIGVRDLRTYLRRPAGFFSDHLARYSKSRRKAPIYWPLSTASGGYTVWVYYPRLDEDTLYTVVNDHVSPKIGEAEARITQLEHERERAEGREATRLATRINELTEFLDELKQLRQSLKQVAELPYKPSLDDGVQITAAPLCELFRYKKWRNVLEKTWRDLSNGEYDWAHSAYAIWPDRVKDKCREDRSLAIAHNLENLYEGEN